jgi:hypothetical protein
MYEAYWASPKFTSPEKARSVFFTAHLAWPMRVAG